MSRECILLLGANQFQRERALVGVEKATEASVITVSPNVPFHNNKFSFLTIRSVETNPEKLLADVINYINITQMKLIAVIPLNDFVLNAGCAVAEYFNLPYNKKITIENCRHKDKMKAVLEKANLPIVKSHKFSTLEEAEKIAERIGYPLVVKPLNFGGSGGVKKVTHPQELKAAIEETTYHLSNYAAQYDTDTVHMVMETYISRAREISVEVINASSFQQVIGITDKFLCTEPYFSEIGHIVPSSLCKKINTREIEELALEACRALDIRYGMAHVEIKLSEKGESPILIEVGARPAGDGIMDLYEKATGTNLYKIHCKSYLGSLSQEDLPKAFYNVAAIGYLHPKNGKVESIDLNNLAGKDLEYVDSIHLKVQVEQEIISAKNWSTRYGFVEYTLWDNLHEDFDLIGRTKNIANKILIIKEAVN